MNTRKKDEGLDGIQLFNIAFPMIRDYDQTCVVVSELSKLTVTPLDVTKLVEKWKECFQISGGVLTDAGNSFRQEALK